LYEELTTNKYKVVGQQMDPKLKLISKTSPKTSQFWDIDMLLLSGFEVIKIAKNTYKIYPSVFIENLNI
jgi:hypothetical protein